MQAKIDAHANPADLENGVLSDLANFFRRYYQGGDFLALRRYKAGVYAIPYEGEEVKLHWANADQYYIKTSEFLRDYTFKLADGGPGGSPKRVHFKLVEADTEADNKKAVSGQERRFILCAADPLVETDGELVIRFEYRPDADKRKQGELNKIAAEAVLNVPGFTTWKAALAQPAPTEKNPDRKVLDKHLGDYTARNTFDYFIHKDIGGFLRRELDFFIKNEIMHLDDIEAEQAPRVEQYLAKIKAIRAIARKVIAFLEQLENFQKKLWLKKKFVVATDWCVTLDRVAESLYPEIAASDAQRAEWVRLFAIDDIKADLAKPGYSAPLTVEFLRTNPFLVLDTKFFPAEFKEKLLADNKILGGAATLDEATDGLLVHSENFNALGLLQARFREQVKCIYIDPPYNTGWDAFPYKDNYQHSSWLSLVADRLNYGLGKLPNDGLLLISIDDIEVHRLRMLCESQLPTAAFISQFVWKSRQHLDSRAISRVSNDHEYILAYGKTSQATLRGAEKDLTKYSNRDNDPRGAWMSRSMLGLATADQRPNLHYNIVNPATGIAYPCPPHTGWRYSPATMQQKISESRILFPKEADGRPREKVFQSDLKEEFTGFSSVIADIYTAQGSAEIREMFGFSAMQFPKPSALLTVLLEQSLSATETVLDFFGGSGTTGHAVVNLNREDGGKRKYILVEMGDHFDTVLKPRIQKVIYSKDWKDGKPVSRAGSSHLFKYLRLESYEDALNNLELRRTPEQDDLLGRHAPLREDYMLRYQLDVETRDSASLLNLAQFSNPFAYQLKIATGSVGESRPVNVDLIETFNYLLGLRVSHTDTIRGFKVVTGLNPAGEKTLVIWRNVAEKSNADLDAFFQKQGYNTKDMEFAVIYVNGDNNLENLKRADETWKVRRTEDEFKRLMFDVQDV